MNDDDDDDDDDDDSDEEDEEDEDENQAKAESTAQEKVQSTPKQSGEQEESKYLHTTSTNDPILITHAKCLGEDILCSWKRVPVQASSQKQQQHQNQSTSKYPGEGL